MSKQYSQFRASKMVAWASFLSMVRSPTSVVFSILFPVIFIVVFGSMVDPTALQIKIGVDPRSDTSNLVYRSLMKMDMVQPVPFRTREDMEAALSKGRLTAILNIRQDSPIPFLPHYNIRLVTSTSSAARAPLLVSMIQGIIAGMNRKIFPRNGTVADLETTQLPGRIYRVIDFILPGQLGFSMLMAGVFSSAFLFFSLRQSLVLKRIFATPVSKSWLVLGEMMSRLVFQVLGFAIMVGMGYWLFDFTLIHGLGTFIEMLLFSVFGLIVFMGIGCIISVKIENESSIAPVANTITLPQILLCGLFFSVESYPDWLQHICNILPLTILVDGLRKIAFEGLHLWQMPATIAAMAGWSLLIVWITIKAFRWE